MPKDFVATVHDPARAARLAEALGKGTPIYLQKPHPEWIRMGQPQEPYLCYRLDLEYYSEAQQESLYQQTCMFQHLEPAAPEVREIFKTFGIPLLAENVTVQVTNAFAYAGHPDPDMNPFRFWGQLGQWYDDDEGFGEDFEDYWDIYERDEPEPSYPEGEDDIP